VLLPFPLGALSDRFGCRRIVVPSLLIFGLAGGACAFAPTFETLLALRALQGVGSAGLVAINYAIIGGLYGGQERTTALGYNSSVLSNGTASCPAVGGALAVFGWFYPFLLPLGAIPIAILVFFSLHNPEPHNHEALREQARVVFERLKRREVVGILAGSLIPFVVLFGALQTYLPRLISDSFGTGTFLIGIVIASTSVTAALTSSQPGRLTSYVSAKVLIRVSFLLYAAACVLIPLVPSAWLLFVPMMTFGVAQSLNIPNAYSILNKDAPDQEHRGAFISLNSTVFRLGQVLGPFFMAAAEVPLGLTGAYFATAALAAMFFVALALIR
jgi:ACDE family multidrug resistance protein